MWQQFQCQRQFYINRLHRKLCSLMVRKVSFFQQSLFFIIVLIMATKACYVWRRMTSSPVFTGRLRPWAASGVRENSRFLSAGFLVKLGNQQFFADYELQHSYNSLLCSRLVVGYNSNPACWPIPCFLSLRYRIPWGFSKVYNDQVQGQDFTCLLGIHQGPRPVLECFCVGQVFTFRGLGHLGWPSYRGSLPRLRCPPFPSLEPHSSFTPRYRVCGSIQLYTLLYTAYHGCTVLLLKFSGFWAPAFTQATLKLVF